MMVDEEVSREIVLIVKPVGGDGVPASSLNPLADLVQAATGAVWSLVSVVENQVANSLNFALDAVVPLAVKAVMDRIDVTKLVMDHVDIDAIVAQADLDPIIDRLPLINLAEYIVSEIDLPKIIRESSGGIATDAVNAVRMQSVGIDDLISRVADSLMFLRKGRKLDSSVDPMAGERE